MERQVVLRGTHHIGDLLVPPLVHDEESSYGRQNREWGYTNCQVDKVVHLKSSSQLVSTQVIASGNFLVLRKLLHTTLTTVHSSTETDENMCHWMCNQSISA